MMDYKFTTDWFNWCPPVWSKIIQILPERKSFLEIGSFEGRSTVWTIENMLVHGGEIHCIDTWEGGEEHAADLIDGCEERFKKNIQIAKKKFPEKKVIAYKGSSVSALARMIDERKSFDFIYIDGSHIAKDVLTDACMAWPMLKRKGVLVFDDYAWRPQELSVTHRPKISIDAFTTIFEEELEIIHCQYQLIVRKL